MTWQPDQMYHFPQQRGEFGFSDQDWWSGDIYLTGLIGTMALHLRDHGNGHPSHMTLEEWKDVLTKIGEPLLAYANGTFSQTRESSTALTADARAALVLFSNHFDHFWD